MQSQYIKYFDTLVSFTQDISFLGMIMPGRYSGLDSVSITGTWTFRISPGNGITVVDYNSVTLGPWAVWVTKQGVYIREDAAVQETITGALFDFVVSPNTGNYTRYDAIYGEHDFVPGTGPQTDATYHMIMGNASLPTLDGPDLNPTLPNPDRQILLGYIAVPKNATGVSDCTWMPMAIPSPNNSVSDIATLSGINIYQATQMEKQELTAITDPYSDPLTGTAADGYWRIPPTGNTLAITPPINNPGTGAPWLMFGIAFNTDSYARVQAGTKLRLILNSPHLRMQNMGINGTTDPSGFFDGKGFRPIHIPPIFVSNIFGGTDCLLGGSSTSQIVVDLELTDLGSGEVWEVQNVRYMNASKMQLRGAFKFDTTTAQGGDAPLSFSPTPSTGANFYYLPWLGGGVSKFINTAWATYNAILHGITVTRQGSISVNLSLGVLLDFTASTWSAATDQTYDGPGALQLKLVVTKFAGGTETYVIDKLDEYELTPWQRGAAVGGLNPISGSKQFSVILKGSHLITLAVGDVISPVLTLNCLDTSVAWSYIRTEQGISKFEGEFLGADLEASI